MFTALTCKLFKRLTLVLLILFSGCASPIYSPIGDPTFKTPELARVRTDTETYLGLKARWGGNITRVENHQDETWVEVIEHKLSRSGHPKNDNASGGRFIARIPGFLDPAIYAPNRQITIIGTLETTIERPIGEHPYTFPVVSVTQHRLWEALKEPPIIYYESFYPPYWYSPFHHRRHYYH